MTEKTKQKEETKTDPIEQELELSKINCINSIQHVRSQNYVVVDDNRAQKMRMFLKGNFVHITFRDTNDRQRLVMVPIGNISSFEPL